MPKNVSFPFFLMWGPFFFLTQEFCFLAKRYPSYSKKKVLCQEKIFLRQKSFVLSLNSEKKKQHYLLWHQKTFLSVLYNAWTKERMSFNLNTTGLFCLSMKILLHYREEQL